MYRTLKLILLLSFFLAGAVSAHAFDLSDKIEFHGFGGWSYGKTDNDNIYLNGNNDGNYDNFQFALAISARPADSLRICAQTFWEESADGEEVGIDYGFAEWVISEYLIFS